MQDEITEAINELKGVRRRISSEAATAQEHKDKDKGTGRDDEIIKWSEDLRQKIDKHLGWLSSLAGLSMLSELKDEVADFDKFVEEGWK